VVRRWLVQIGVAHVRDLFRFRIAHARGAGSDGRDLVERWRKAHKVILQHPPLTTGELAINGRDLKALGLAPGPQFGEILDALLLRVLEQPDLNDHATLLRIVQTEFLA
jgi:tRNA nucleotidyltransferase (CCA-adding enzyme)